MVNNYTQFENAIKNNKQSETLHETALAVLSEHQDHSWLGIFNACQYLFYFNSETGEYDKIIIEGLENALMSGLNIRSDPDKFLDATKTQARLYFKYSSFRKASSSLLNLTENADLSDLPDWVNNYSAKIDIYTEIEYYLLKPDKLLGKIPLVELSDRQRVSIYKEFLRVAYEHYSNNNGEAVISFINSVEPFIGDHPELFGNEWQALNSLIDKTKPEELAQIDVNELKSINIALQEENDELRQWIVELEAEFEKLTINYEKLRTEHKKQIDDYKENIATIREDFTDSGRQREYMPKILVLGASKVKDIFIYKIAEDNCGISRENIDIKNDYEKNKRFDIKKLQYNSKYDGILIGPIAHKVCGMGDNSSLIQTMKHEGYPPIEEIRTESGKLKITGTGFKKAMDNLKTKINSNIPSG